MPSVRFSTKPYRSFILLSLPALLVFISSGWILLQKLGLQSDEVMFIYDLWHPQSAASWGSIFNHRMPLMLMSYLGALKSWLYAPIFFFFDPGKESLRIPTLLLATGTIIICGIVAARIAGKTAAILLVWLLATDVTFLLTAVFDWGPVVLQNLLLAGGIFFVAEWWRRQRSENWMLFLGSLLFGLALWDKALFLWNFSAMIVAVTILNPRAVLRTFRFKPLLLMALGLVLGAFPLLLFNLTGDRSTIGENAHLTWRELAPKGKALEQAIDGVSAQIQLTDFAVIARKGMHPPAVVSSWRSACFLIALPLGLIFSAPRLRRWIAFFLLSAAIAWFQAAITINAGGSIHHIVLLWPFLYIALALSVTAIADAGNRWIAIGAFTAVAILCLRGLQTIDRSSGNLSSYSNVVQWANADKPLCDRLKEEGVKRVVAVDWGIANVIAAETADRVSVIDETFELAARRFDKDRFFGCTGQDCVIVAHAQGREIFPVATAFLQESMRSRRLGETQVSIISDSHNVPSFLVFRIKRQ